MINSASMNTTKKKHKIIQSEDSIEALKGLPGSVRKAVTQETKNVVSDIWKQMLRPDSLPQREAGQPQNQAQSGDLRPGEELNLQEKKTAQYIEPGIDYSREIIHAEKKIQAESTHETKVKMQEIIIEIKKLTSSSKELAAEFKDVQKMEQIPANAGKYHANFVEWILSMVRGARERVDNAITWTSAMKNKRAQKQYWNLFKKHGTSFGLSGERTMATQTG